MLSKWAEIKERFRKLLKMNDDFKENQSFATVMQQVKHEAQTTIYVNTDSSVSYLPLSRAVQ